MNLVRAFIALEIPPEIQDQIDQKTAALRTALGSRLVRWVPAANLHLTLKFLGEISPAQLALLKQALERIADETSAFDLQVAGLGCFPSARRARVLWIGLSAPAALNTLQHSVEAACTRLGYPPEGKPFSPHLTIGRVSQNASRPDEALIAAALEHSPVNELGTARMDRLVLFRSDLKPSGAVYTPLLQTHFSQSNPR